MQRVNKVVDYIPFRGIFEILRYKEDGKTLLHKPYRDPNTIVNIGRQFIRGMLASSSTWSNFPTVGTSWGDMQPLANNDLFISRMKLGMSSISASPVDEELISPIGDNIAKENLATGDGATTVFAPAALVGAPVRKTLVISTWVRLTATVKTYLYAVDDGNGNIFGSKDVFVTGTGWVSTSVTGTIDYTTKLINLTYSHAPWAGDNIDVTYETAVTAVDVFAAGGVSYSNNFGVLPIGHRSLTIVASGGGGGGTVGFASDVGSGIIQGTFLIGGVTLVNVTGTIEYTTGSLVLNFSVPLPPGVNFAFGYRVDWSHSVSTYFPSPYTVRFEVTLGAADFAGYRFAEEGIFTDSTLDLMLARKAFTPFEKGVGEITVFRHSILF